MDNLFRFFFLSNDNNDWSYQTFRMWIQIWFWLFSKSSAETVYYQRISWSILLVVYKLGPVWAIQLLCVQKTWSEAKKKKITRYQNGNKRREKVGHMAADFLSEIGRPGPEYEQQRKGRMTQNKKKLRLTKMKKKKMVSNSYGAAASDEPHRCCWPRKPRAKRIR